MRKYEQFLFWQIPSPFSIPFTQVSELKIKVVISLEIGSTESVKRKG